VVLAGGSVSAVPALPKAFLEAIPAMEPSEVRGQYILSKEGEGLIVFQDDNAALEADMTHFNGIYQLQRIDARNGAVLGKPEKIKGGKVVSLSSKGAGPVIYWFSKK
jgi:hypothetical protein